MVVDGCAIAEDFCSAYSRRDLELAGTFLADDVIFAMHVDRTLMPFAGVTIGKAIMQRRWNAIVEQFDMPFYQLQHVVAKGNVVRSTVAYIFRHKATGEDLEGHMRHVIELRRGLIARVNEYHDRSRVEAYFRLLAMREAIG